MTLRLPLLATAIAVLFSSCGTPSSREDPKPFRYPQQQAAAPPRVFVPQFPVEWPPADPTISQWPANAPWIKAQSYVLVDIDSGKTIAYKNLDQVRAVASTQKLLTALLVLERGNIRAPIIIEPVDTKAPPSKMGLRVGQRITREELLTVVLVKSANDASEALARDHSGSVPAFADAMNRRARQLGAYRSFFVNPHGLTEPGQRSTARDIARIALASFRQPFVRTTARRQSAYVAGKTYKATNKLLARMPECTGLKTGYTRAAGRCLVSTAQFGRKKVMLVQLGSETKYIFNDAEKMMRWGAGQRVNSRPALVAR